MITGLKSVSHLADAILQNGTTEVLKKLILPVRSERKFLKVYPISMF